MKISIMRLELVGQVMLVFLNLNCLAECVKFPSREDIGIPGYDVSRPGHGHGRGGLLSAGNQSSRRSRSILAVNSSQLNATAEAEMLLQFRQEVTLDPFNVLSGWNSSNVSNYCNWRGVQCSSSLGQVTALNLSGHQLEGSISTALGGLQFLTSLDLSFNSFLGVIPPSIANCSNLKVLILSTNALSGTIPLKLMALSNLEVLSLLRNKLTGVVSSSISNLSALQVLHLGGNSFHGDIPDSLGSCSNLTLLGLAMNNFTGTLTIPFEQLQNLQILYLGANSLSGSIPSALGSCKALAQLDLSQNQFSGSIPPSLGDCTALTYLDLSQNNLSGVISTFPFENLKNLTTLYLHDNFFSGPIPSSLGGCKALTDLELSYNLLSGKIPTDLGNLQNLQYLYLNTNNLSGPIPASLLNCTALQGLVLYQNQLTGIIPDDIGVLSQLRNLYLWGNSMTGSIPSSLANCTKLNMIILSLNFITGEIPQGLGNLTELEHLYLHFNQLVGSIPPSLGQSKALSEVLLDDNQLTGKIPSELGLLKNLSKLDLGTNFLFGQIPPALFNATTLLSLALGYNQLQGPIPTSIGNLGNLQGLNLSGNQLTGGIPDALSHCIQLSVLDLSRNLLTGDLPDSMVALVNLNRVYLNNNFFTGTISGFGAHSTNLIELSLAHNNFSGDISEVDFSPVRGLQLSLDISDNYFTGALPPGIGALESVQSINFSFNAFSGHIPPEFGECIGLQSLDLSSNRLTGDIPPQLDSLSHLTYFNVSSNQLTGAVPDSGQFANFSAGSYLGNPGLCGPMLSNKCTSSCHGITCHHLWIVIIPSVAAGIAGILALVAIWFLFIQKTRDSTGIVPVHSIPHATNFTTEFEDLTLGDIMAATNGFSDSNIMGMGAKSTVFSGILPSRAMIAVKRLELRNDDKATGHLYRTLQRLSKVEHPNLLKVHGMFSTGDLKVLVLEYMPNGSLYKQLHDGEVCHLTWAQRLNIAIGVAEGMVHLHHAHAKPVLHLDLKPSNILLDPDMQPKVADYGIFSYVNHENHDVTISSNLYGTIGYIPPEYGALSSVSTMGDVYNFGVVLMELFTRKKPTDDMFGPEVSLRSWVVGSFPKKISQILDSGLRQELSQNEQEVGIHLMVRLAIACTINNPRERPTMMEARDMLMEINSIEQPHMRVVI